MMKLFVLGIISICFLPNILCETTCTTVNWGKSFDYPGFSTCKRKDAYINGIYRNKNDNRKVASIYLIESVSCCQLGKIETGVVRECLDKVLHFERNDLWESCPAGYFLNGLERDSDIRHDSRLRNIKRQRCCKPKDHPSSWGHCYEYDISVSFDKMGWVNCKKEGYFIAGIYKSRCDWLNCIETLKCCKMASTYVPSQYKFNNKSVTWLEAEIECHKWGGNLATITSTVQNDYLANELKKRNMDSAWIGLNDREKEGSFEWINPLESNGYTNFKNGEPNGGRRENCVEIIPGKKYSTPDWKGKWNDESCCSQRPFICQVPNSFQDD